MKSHSKGTKHCNSCRCDLPLSSFNRSRHQRDGLQGYCKSCSKEASRERRRRRREALAAAGVLAESKSCRACQTTRSAEWFARVSWTRDGLDDVCKSCRPILAEEKGLGLSEPCCKLSPEEVRALSLLRDVTARARRARKKLEVDWAFLMDRLHAGRCEETGQRLVVALRTARKALIPRLKILNPFGGWTEDNCRLVCSAAAQ